MLLAGKGGLVRMESSTDALTCGSSFRTPRSCLELASQATPFGEALGRRS
jgi:hypothetical protein